MSQLESSYRGREEPLELRRKVKVMCLGGEEESGRECRRKEKVLAYYQVKEHQIYGLLYIPTVGCQKCDKALRM